MCLAEVVRVREVRDDTATATATTGGRDRVVSLALLTLEGISVTPGDWLACHLGIATRLLTPAEAAEIETARRPPTGRTP